MSMQRGHLQKVLKTLSVFDPGGSPYIGMQTSEAGVFFYRSSPSGYIHSVGYERGSASAIVSLSHFQESLGRMPDDEVTVGFDVNGIVRLTTNVSGFQTDVRVHTVHNSTPWASTHNVGTEETQVEPTAFTGINLRRFSLASPPLLKNNKLMLITDSGVVVRSEVPVEAYPHPREVFIKSIRNLEVKRMFITSGKYWGAVAGGFELYVSGHTAGENLFLANDKPATERIATLPAARLVQALDYAAAMCGENYKVEVHPKHGVSTRDGYGGPGVFGFGDAGNWKPFSIKAATAEMIADALGQSPDEVATLETTSTGGYRLTRGLWATNFKGQ